MPSKLDNLSMSWRYSFRNIKTGDSIVRGITISLSKNGGSISISGESYEWINSIFNVVNVHLTKRKTLNNLKRYIYGFSLGLLPFVILLLFNFIKSDQLGIILIAWFFIGLSILPSVVTSFFPYVDIIVDSIGENRSWFERIIESVLIGLIVTIIGALILKYFGMV